MFVTKNKLNEILRRFAEQLFEKLELKHPPLHPSYKMEIVLFPNWYEILRPEIEKLKIKNDTFMEMILASGYDEKKSLYGKHFRIVTFKDSHSRVEQIWSDHYKTFVNNTEHCGYIFADMQNIPKSLKENKFPNTPINISQSLINYGFYGDSEETLQRFPFSSIFYLLEDICLNIGNNDYQIKKFPHEIENELRKSNFEYIPQTSEISRWASIDFNTETLQNDWLIENNIELFKEKSEKHVFKGKFIEIYLSINFFN